MAIDNAALFLAIREIKGKSLTQPEVDRINAILLGGPAPVPAAVAAGVRALGDPTAFFAAVRADKTLFAGSLSQAQVDGMGVKLAAMGTAGWSTAWVADALATSFLESNKTMQPVAEAYWIKNAEAWRKANLRYYPWYGRGDVQLTWEANYRKADAEAAAAGLIQAGALIADPTLAMRPDLAAFIMVRGMSEGWFAKDASGVHNLARHLPAELGTRPQFEESRRIINGVDRKADLATYALAFQPALVAGHWGLQVAG